MIGFNTFTYAFEEIGELGTKVWKTFNEKRFNFTDFENEKFKLIPVIKLLNEVKDLESPEIKVKTFIESFYKI